MPVIVVSKDKTSLSSTRPQASVKVIATLVISDDNGEELAECHVVEGKGSHTPAELFAISVQADKTINVIPLSKS